MKAVYFCLVLFITGIVAIDDVREIYIQPYDQVIIESDNYPEHTTANATVKWVVTTDPEYLIHLACNEIRFWEENPCENWALHITEGNETDEICRTEYSYSKMFKTNKIEINLKTGPVERGYFNCFASSVTEDESYEDTSVAEDSSLENTSPIGDSSFELQ